MDTGSVIGYGGNASFDRVGSFLTIALVGLNQYLAGAGTSREGRARESQPGCRLSFGADGGTHE